LVVIARGWLVISVGTALTFAGGTARAENLDAGKSAPALFAATCVACHASAKGLAKNTSGGLVSYLREHYTASPESASILAAYLIANAGDPRAKQAPAAARAAAPAEGAPGAKRHPGQTAQPPAAKTEPPARSPQTATARPDSMIEPVESRRHHEEPAKGAKGGKRQPAKQETTAAPPSGGAEPSPAASPPAASPPPAAPVAAAPPPDQPAFSAPSP
jgi:hypothetical protein